MYKRRADDGKWSALRPPVSNGSPEI